MSSEEREPEKKRERVLVRAPKGSRILISFPDGNQYVISRENSLAIQRSLFMAGVDARFETEPTFERLTPWVDLKGK